MKKILFLTYRMDMGFGVDLVISKLTNYLRNKFTISICCLEDSGAWDDLDISVVGLNIKDLQIKIDRWSPDFVVAHSSPFFEMLPCLRGAFIRLCYEHGDPSSSFFSHDARERQLIIDNKLKFIYPNVDGVIAISKFIANDIGWPQAKIILNGADHVLPSHNAEYCKKNSTGVLRVGTLMRLGSGESFYKGKDLFIELAEKLLAEKLPIEFFLMGKGTDDDALELRKKNISVLLNASEFEKISYLQDLDVFISPSQWEGFNLPIVEAMSLGTVGWAFDTGAHPEVTPFIANSMFELVNMLKEYMVNRELLSLHSNLAHDFVLKNFTWNNAADEFANYLNKFLNEQEIDVGDFVYNQENKLQHINVILDNQNINACVSSGLFEPSVNILYGLDDYPLVSIIIPFKDKPSLLEGCLGSIFELTTYTNFEVICIDNNSIELTTFEAIERLSLISSKVSFHRFDEEFNYSRINNYAVKNFVHGEHIVFLNNDIQIITPNWIEVLLSFSQQNDVGAVGCKLYYANDNVQHAGVVLGLNGLVGHAFRGAPRESLSGYRKLAFVNREVSIVTAACLMLKTHVFQELNGFDEVNLKIDFNDVDLCLRLQEKGYRNIFTPFCEAYHYESISRGAAVSDSEMIRFQKEVDYMKLRHAEILSDGDQYYHKNLAVNSEDYQLNLSLSET